MKKRVWRGTTSDDTGRFRRFLAGDDHAFHQLFERHNGPLTTYAFKVVGRFHVAEDLVQESWVRLIGMRSAPPANVSNPTGLMFRIVRNLCLDYLKSPRSGHDSLQVIGEAHHPVTTTRERSSEEEIVLQALERIPAEYRETLLLHIYSGYSYEEIATMLGKTPDAIWARASRGRKKLRELVTRALEREEEALKLIGGGDGVRLTRSGGVR